MAPRNKVVFRGKVRDGDGWIPFKVMHLAKSGMYELELDDGGSNYTTGTFISVQDAVQHVLENYGSW